MHPLVGRFIYWCHVTSALTKTFHVGENPLPNCLFSLPLETRTLNLKVEPFIERQDFDFSLGFFENVLHELFGLGTYIRRFVYDESHKVNGFALQFLPKFKQFIVEIAIPVFAVPSLANVTVVVDDFNIADIAVLFVRGTHLAQRLKASGEYLLRLQNLQEAMQRYLQKARGVKRHSDVLRD